jgi:hypothetical protein
VKPYFRRRLQFWKGLQREINDCRRGRISLSAGIAYQFLIASLFDSCHKKTGPMKIAPRINGGTIFALEIQRFEQPLIQE